MSGLGLEDWLADETEHELLGRATAAHEVRRHRHLMVDGDSEHPSVEQLVVERAQTEGVVDRVRALERPPAEVRRIETNRFRPQPTVEPDIADRYS